MMLAMGAKRRLALEASEECLVREEAASAVWEGRAERAQVAPVLVARAMAEPVMALTAVRMYPRIFSRDMRRSLP